MSQPSPEEIEQAEAKFRRYQKLNIMCATAFSIFTVMRFSAIESQLNLGAFGLVLQVAAGLAWAVSAVHAFRCTLCEGGLKINGRTCSKCGHEFKKKQGT